MFTNYLKKGDIINIKKGMKVYASIPDRFIDSNKFMSKNSHDQLIPIGEILRIKCFDLVIIFR